MVSTQDKERTFSDVVQGLFDGTERLSHSSFKEFCKSPRHFVMYKTRKDEPTKAMNEGSIFHCLCLEPDLFDERYIVQTVPSPSSQNQKDMAADMAAGMDISGAYLRNYSATKITPAAERKIAEMQEHLEAYAEFLYLVGDREIVSGDFYETACMLRDQIYNNAASRFYLDMITETEKAVQWDWKGFNWHGHIDAIGTGVIVDLKRVADADPDKIARQIRYTDFAYQSVHYRNAGYHKYRFVYVCIDNAGHISVNELNEHTIGAIRETLEYKISKFKTCLLQNQWDQSYDFWVNGGVYYV